MFCWYWRKYAFRVWYSENCVAEQTNADTRPHPPEIIKITNEKKTKKTPTVSSNINSEDVKINMLIFTWITRSYIKYNGSILL